MGKLSELNLTNQERDREDPPEGAEFRHLGTSEFEPKTDGEYIPGTNPKWGRKLPDGDYNSLVDNNGNNCNNSYNFDEHDPEDKNDDIPEFDPEAARKAREEAIREQSQED